VPVAGPLASLDLVMAPAFDPPVPDAKRVVSSPLAGEIDSARVCRVDSELEWHPSEAIAIKRSDAANTLRTRAKNAVKVAKRGMGQRAWDESNRTFRPRAVLLILRPWPLTPQFLAIFTAGDNT
jgi:hypothetical protein